MYILLNVGGDFLMSIPFLFEPQNLTVLLNIGLLAIVLLIILFAAFSMLRKAIPQIFHLVFYLVVMVVGIAFMRPLANWVGNYDLSSLNQSVSYKEEIIPITTLLETTRQLLQAVAKSEGEKSFLFIAVTNGDVASYIEGLSIMIVAYITFFLYALLAMILCWPISSLIYHCGFKFIFKKEQRKYKFKRRWKSFAIGFASATVSVAMLLSPLTAFANSINYGVQKNRTQEDNRLDTETYDNYISWVDAYNDSIFAKLLFGNKGNSLDIMLMDYTTRMDFNGEELLFSDQIATIADTAEKLISLGLLSEDGKGFTTSALFGKGVISTLIKTVTDSDFLLKIIPILARIALNYAEVNEILNTEHLSTIPDLDWKKQLQQVDRIYTALYDAGLVGDLTDDSVLEVGLPQNKELMYEAFDILDQTELFQTVIPAILYYYVTNAKVEETTENLDILSYLSKDWEDYKSIKWGSELRVFYDTIMGLDEKFDIQFTVKKDDKKAEKKTTLKARVFHTGFMTHPSLKEENRSEEETAQSPLIKVLFGEKSNEVIEFLTNYNVEEEAFTEDGTCLLDSGILMKLVQLDTLLPDVLDKNLKDESGNSYIDLDENQKKEMQNKLAQMQKEPTHKEIKKELAYIMRFASYILDENQVNIHHPDNILNDETSREAIKKASPYIDKSYLLKTIVPSLFEKLLKDVDFGEDIPLKGSDFNFKKDNIVFGEEIPLLLDAYENILSVSEAMAEPELKDKLTKLDASKLAKALHNILKSKIINPPSENNKNFESILNVIFNNEDMKQMGIYSDSNVDYSLVKNWDVEIDAIAEVFTQIQVGDFVNLLTGNNFAMKDMKADSILDLFRSIDGSILLRNTFGTVLDKNLASALQIDEELSENITFKNVTSWEDEGANLKAVIEVFQRLPNDADLATIDWLNSDTTISHDLIQAVADMQLFQNPKDESKNYFGSYIHHLLTANNSGLGDYLKDYPAGGTPTYNTSKNDFEHSVWKSTEGEITEVDAIIGVLDTLQSIGKEKIKNDSTLDATKPGTIGLNTLSSGNVSATDMREVINSLSDSNALRMVAVNGVSSAIQGENSPLKLEGINLNDINIGYLSSDASKEERKAELTRLADTYETIDSLDILSGSIQNLDATIVSSLLSTLHQSHLFNSFEDASKNVADRTELTLFEQMIYYLFEEAGVLDYVTEASEVEARKIEFKQIILDIKNDLCGTSTTISSEQDGWGKDVNDKKEIAYIEDVISKLSGHNSLTSEILLDMTTSDLQALLKSMNHSKLMHKAVYKFYDSALKTIGFNAFLDLNSLDYKLMDYDGDKEERHDQEIELFVNLIQEARVKDTIDGEGNAQVTYFDFEHEDIKRWVQSKDDGGDGKSLVPFFSLLFHSEVLKYKSTSGKTHIASAEILYNVLKKSNNDKYISGTTEEERINRIETFFKAPYQMSDENEGQSMNRILCIMNSSFSGTFEDISTNEELSNNIYKIMLSAYNYKCVDDAGNVVNSEFENENRAYLSSEIVANYLKAFDPTQNETSVDARITWIESVDNNTVDIFRVTSATAEEVQSIFTLKRAYTNLVNEQSDNNKVNFKSAAYRIDLHKANDAEYDDVLGKLVATMFDNSICQKSYNLSYNGFPLGEMTLEEFFRQTYDIDGLRTEAKTYEEKAERIILVADQLN